MPKEKVVIIGAGLGGITAAAKLADRGYNVTVVEKNKMPGGRAWQFEAKGFRFDMGPSWYMMHEVFEKFFKDLGENYKDYYKLELLSPTYRAFFDDDKFDVYSDMDKNKDKFEAIEKGSFNKITKILKKAKFLYENSVHNFLYKPFLKITDFFDIKFAFHFISNRLFDSYAKFINKRVKSKKLRDILSWHPVFIGGTPQNVPSLYILMLYVDLVLGTYFPNGGMYNLSKGFEKVAKSKGVNFVYDQPVEKIIVENGEVTGLKTKNKIYEADIVVSNADYHHTETQLLDKKYRSYSEEFWQKQKMSPATLLIFLGINKKVSKLLHHNYYFTENPEKHFESIEKESYWPDKPSFYINCPSKSDPTCAPQNSENIMILIPVAPDLKNNDIEQKKIYNYAINKLEAMTGEKIEKNIIFKKILAHKEFKSLYNAYKGNAFGLANTLFQTGSFRPRLKSKKVDNLYFTGTTTVPGVGMPLAVISGQVVSDLIIKNG